MGGVFPLTVRIAAARLDSVGRDIGNAYALNTVGAIVGSFLSGFVVLPKLGLQRGIYVAVLGDLIARWPRSFAVAPGLPRARRAAGVARGRRAGAHRARAAALEPGDVLVGVLPRVDRARVHLAPDPQEGLAGPQAGLLRGRHRDHGHRRSVGQDVLAQEQRQGRRLERRRHGDADHRRPAAAAALRQGRRRPRSRWSASARASPRAPSRSTRSSRSRSSSSSRRSTARRTSSTTTTTARWRTRKVTARVGDGRNFLTQRSDTFDVIVSQPSNPWLTGVSNLFTREYFRDIKTRLAPHGICSASGRSSTRCRPGTSRRSTAPCARSSPTSTSSRPRICRRTRSSSRSRSRCKLDLATLERAFRDPVDARRGAARRPRLAARRLRVPAARPRGARVVHRRLARQHRRQRADRIRGAARSARATPSSIPTWPRSTARCGPTAG